MAEEKQETPIEDGLTAYETLRRLAQGDFLEMVHGELIRVSDEVMIVGKPGAVTITLRINPVKNSNSVTIDEEIKPTMPKSPARGALVFINDSQTYDHDPRQRVIPGLQVVSDTAAKQRELADDAPLQREVQ